MKDNKERTFSIRYKMFVFVVLTVFIVAFGTSAIAFYTSVNQIDAYYKKNAKDNARNFASMVDGDYLMELRIAAESEEFQQLRDAAEEADDDEPVIEYLKEHGLWEKYDETRTEMSNYLRNIDDIKYLYMNAVLDKDAEYDMYLMDDDSNPAYQTGYYEEREEELRGLDLRAISEPTISNGDWGWLCTAFYPVYTSDGTYVCLVGCDVGMDDVMLQRSRFLVYLVIGALIITAVVVTCAVIFINKIVVKPLNDMTTEMKRFKPNDNTDYKTAGVIELDVRSHDEIADIYRGIRKMQIDIIDHLNDLNNLQEEKLQAEKDIEDKEKQIGQLSKDTYRDALTGVGNKLAYIRKTEELGHSISDADAGFAIVMVDINKLKQINDVYGHNAGDQYIKGCSHVICDAFKHSPVFRIGGDEFVAVLQGVDYDKRHEICDDLKKSFAETYAQEDKDPWERYSAAVGMAEKASDDLTVDLVFRRADKIMYADKEKFKSEHGSYR